MVPESDSLGYGAATWAIWFLAVSWLFAPFWFNPLCFEWSKVTSDFEDWLEWMKRVESDPSRSWKAWFKQEQEHLQYTTFGSKVGFQKLTIKK